MRVDNRIINTRTAKALFVLILPGLLFCSCRSSRSMQKEINQLKASLFYELTSPEYLGEVTQKVYLDFIDYSNLDYYTTIKKKGGFVVPLLVFNYEKNRFRVRLGENSLTQTYREFLTEALLTECNSSTAFNLIDNKKGEAPDSVYHLEVKIIRNQTNSKINLHESGLIWFDSGYLLIPNHRAGSAHTDLSIAIRLTRKNDCLLDKTFSVTHQQEGPRYGYETSIQANEASLNTMVECLSLATKEIVETISQELNLAMDIN